MIYEKTLRIAYTEFYPKIMTNYSHIIAPWYPWGIGSCTPQGDQNPQVLKSLI